MSHKVSNLIIQVPQSTFMERLFSESGMNAVLSDKQYQVTFVSLVGHDTDRAIKFEISRKS